MRVRYLPSDCLCEGMILGRADVLFTARPAQKAIFGYRKVDMKTVREESSTAYAYMMAQLSAAVRVLAVKGFFVLMPLFAFLCLQTGCGKNSGGDTAKKGTYAIYCLDRDENKLVEYTYHTDADDTDDIIKELIAEMSSLNDDVSRRESIRGFEVTDYSRTGSQLTLYLSETYKDMMPTTEVLVRAAIVRTLCQVNGVHSIIMRIGDEELLDALGIPVGSMTEAQFIDNEGNEINAYDNIELTLYFASPDGERLKKCLRSVEYNTSISVEKLVVEQLIQGLTEEEEAGGVKATVNPQTTIINVTVKDGICYVNLDNNFLLIPTGVRPEVIIYSIVDSLVELPAVSKVQISIDGNSEISLGENMPLSTLYERNLDIVE